MSVTPDYKTFARIHDAGDPQVIWTTLVADLETPVSAVLKLAGGDPYGFLLESVEGGEIRGRYSIIGLKPDVVWRCHGDRGLAAAVWEVNSVPNDKSLQKEVSSAYGTAVAD